MIINILKSVYRNLKKFLYIWIVVLVANQLVIFGGCFAPYCILAALPHTSIIAGLIVYYACKVDSNENNEKAKAEKIVAKPLKIETKMLEKEDKEINISEDVELERMINEVFTNTTKDEKSKAEEIVAKPLKQETKMLEKEDKEINITEDLELKKIHDEIFKKNLKDEKSKPIELKTIFSNLDYHYIVKFNELNEITKEIPKIGDIFIGSINRKAEDYGIFVDIIKVEQKSGQNYYISGLLHWSKIDKNSPLRNWHRYYRKTYTLNEKIIVMIENINEKGCSLIEIPTNSNKDYNTVRNSDDLLTISLHETKEVIDKICKDSESRYINSERIFYKKEVKSTIKVSYSKKYDSYIYKNKLLITVGLENTYATKDFKKVFIIIHNSENSKIDKVLYANNGKSTKTLFETQDLITEYNQEQYKDFLNFENKKEEHEQYLILKQEEETQFYKRVLAKQPIKIFNMYLIGEIFHEKGSNHPREIGGCSTTYHRYSPDRFVKEIKVYVDKNKEYIYIDNKLKEINNKKIKLINNNLLCIGDDYVDNYNAYYIQANTEIDEIEGINSLSRLNAILELEPNETR